MRDADQHHLHRSSLRRQCRKRLPASVRPILPQGRRRSKNSRSSGRPETAQRTREIPPSTRSCGAPRNRGRAGCGIRRHPPGSWRGGAGPGHNCGTAWTGWVGVPNPDVNPCPKGCERGEVALPLRKRIRHYGGIRQMERRLKTLFHIGCFERMEDAVLRLNANSLSAGVSE